MLHLMRRLGTGVGNGFGVVQGVTRPMHRFRPQGFDWRSLNERKDYRSLDARRKSCVLNDA